MARSSEQPPVEASAAAALALTIFCAPALGVPGELMLQDTLKSALVAFGALIAALLFLRAQRGRQAPLLWHDMVCLPLLLMAYALGSMAWSHRYLAGVEAVRWFVFSLIAWLGLNTFTRDRLPLLAACIHGGALVASLWAMLQFWGGLQLFPQGPQPASTFVNRNFFAEFATCTLPFGLLLLARARHGARALALAVSSGIVITALLMTGTRSALVALWLQLLVVLPAIAWRCRAQLAFCQWPRSLRALAPLVLFGTVLVLGAIPTGNARILSEGHGATALQRALQRTESIGPQDYSLGLRLQMWEATARAIRAEPIIGLGSGAWEAKVPLYERAGAQIETDYYVHNEFLQLVAEYGLAGWAFLLLLAAYLLQAAWRTWRAAGEEADADRPWRAVFLASLLALMVVSSIGFPWRLASTGALFALCLGGLAATDARLAWAGVARARPLHWSRGRADVALAGTAACLLLAAFITQRAAASESRLVQATEIALDISASGHPEDPALAGEKARMLQLVREGIALNPHYRKITPIVADELARWGDWRNATWIWESVLASRPYIVAILANAARGHSAMGDQRQAMVYLERARRLQPDAPAVRSVEIVVLASSGQEQRARELARQAMQAGIVDFDIVNAAFILAWRAHDYEQARQVLQQRMARWPESRARGEVQMGLMAAEQGRQQEALAAFRRGLAQARPQERGPLLQMLPQSLRGQL
ncbi:O-antigen ligase family protein [Ramlibacter sp.]|uniref:O-antigen ligase family protein n=1 Tax=Ramlibacter sp. TaxID=1917967 RepID=UPI00260990F8|nr:O-antigen ligase family protein [Ramlibacter sp.]MDB5958273.1 O-antigen polymerase [Ramlibacter sp.]